MLSRSICIRRHGALCTGPAPVRFPLTVTRLSSYFLPTEREPPADAEALSHKLMVRAGLIRQLGAGLWSWLPAGWRVHQRIVQIVREEMDAIGGQEVHFPALLPKEPYEITGRWTEYGDGNFFAGLRQPRDANGSAFDEVDQSRRIALVENPSPPRIAHDRKDVRVRLDLTIDRAGEEAIALEVPDLRRIVWRSVCAAHDLECIIGHDMFPIDIAAMVAAAARVVGSGSAALLSHRPKVDSANSAVEAGAENEKSEETDAT